MKLGGIALAVGLPLLGIAIFGIGTPNPLAVYAFGLGLLVFGVVRLLWAGWRGSISSWLVAAPAAAILAWTLYELVRQEVHLYGIGILREMTAPSLSGAVLAGTLIVGWLHHHAASRDIRQR